MLTVAVSSDGVIIPAPIDGATPFFNCLVDPRVERNSPFLSRELRGHFWPSVCRDCNFLQIIRERKWSVESWQTSENNKRERKTQFSLLP